MPRKRMIDPEFWSDQEIGFWSFEARLFYIATWNFADDEGRFKAHMALLKSQIFPYDLKINIELLKKEIATKIQWYEVNGSQYGYVCNFLKYQRIDRPTLSKLPPPPEIRRELIEVLASTREHLDPNISKVKLSKDHQSYDFESVWALYPKQLGRKKAERFFRMSVKNNKDFDDIKKALAKYRQHLSDSNTAKQYIQNGATWFNNWRDWIDFSDDLKMTSAPSPA